MSHLARRRLGTVLDLGKQLRFDADALVRDALDVGLRFSDQRRQALLQIGSGALSKP
jgi:hypothetical protein